LTKTHYDAKCDVFSIGVIFYILLTGEKPIKVLAMEEVEEIHEKCKIDFTNETFNLYSDHCIGLLTLMLQKDPEERPNAT